MSFCPKRVTGRQLCIFYSADHVAQRGHGACDLGDYIIEGVNNVEGVPPNSFAVLIRFHHAYVDGKSSLELSTAMMEETADHDMAGAIGSKSPSARGQHLEMWAPHARGCRAVGNRSVRAGLLFGRKRSLNWRAHCGNDGFT